MRFDVVDLYLLRYPYGDELLDNIVFVAALPDATGFVQNVLETISCSEIKTRTIENPERTVEYFSMYQPDVLMVNIDVVNSEYIEAVTELLEKKLRQMPVLVIITNDNYFEGGKYTEKYNGYYYLTPTVNKKDSAENLKEFLLTKLVSMDYLKDKLKRCSAQTLKAMKCNPLSDGFKWIVDCVYMILQKPYGGADYYTDVIEKAAIENKISTDKLETHLKTTVKQALKAMSPFEKSVAFPKCYSQKKDPTYMEFLCTAAEITSMPCKKILRYIEDEPFFNKSRDMFFI